MRKILYIVFVVFAMSFTSCELVDGLLNNEGDGLSTDEVVQGLKTALEVGTDTSVTVTSKEDGYYKDEVIKVLLPDDVEEVYELRNNAAIQALGISDKINSVEKSLNRAAEDASTTAKPIFKDAIFGLSISDGFAILNGSNPAKKNRSAIEAFDSTAATNYLVSTTRNKLVEAFAPKIDGSLAKKILDIFGTRYSANDLWDGIKTPFNAYATSIFNVTSSKPITTNLSQYVTGKALDGLFHKVGVMERKIRKDPFKWALDILQKVFGSVMAK